MLAYLFYEILAYWLILTLFFCLISVPLALAVKAYLWIVKK